MTLLANLRRGFAKKTEVTHATFFEAQPGRGRTVSAKRSSKARALYAIGEQILERGFIGENKHLASTDAQ